MKNVENASLTAPFWDTLVRIGTGIPRCNSGWKEIVRGRGSALIKSMALSRLRSRDRQVLRIVVFVAVALIIGTQASATSDLVLRAAYCMKILDGEIARDQSTLPIIIKQTLEDYQRLSMRRPLTPAERENYAAVQKSAALAPQLLQSLQANRSRLASYWMTNSGIISGALSADPDALNGALESTVAIKTAIKHGEVDFAQCEAEIVGSTNPLCANECSRGCRAGEPVLECRQECDMRCGAPTCARTVACINPTFLPY